MTRKLNIHGDNIVECERSFKLCKLTEKSYELGK